MIRSPSGIQLQRSYGLDILSKYGMIGCKPILVPLEQNTKLYIDIGKQLEDVTMERHIVESLMTITKPNLSYDVGFGQSIDASSKESTSRCS